MTVDVQPSDMICHQQVVICHQQPDPRNGMGGHEVAAGFGEIGGYERPHTHEHPHESMGVATSDLQTVWSRLGKVVVIDDLWHAGVWRAAMFEGVATFVLVFVGVNITISTFEQNFSKPVLCVAIFQGVILAFCILASAPASGGHVNPTITFTEMLTGHISPIRAMLYIMGQVLGSIIAAFAAKVVVGHTLATQYNLAGCYLRSQASATSGVVGIEVGRAFLLEVVLVFFVLFIAYSIALDPPQLPKTGYILAVFFIGGLVGLCIYVSAGLASGYGGAGINPARCIGPAVAMRGAMWTDHWIFWVGDILGAFAYAGFYHAIPPTHIDVYKRRKAARLDKKKGIKKQKSGRGTEGFNV